VITTYISLFFTVVLLVTTAYFIMGGIPLLILAHDTPLDGRFVRRFFEIYYSAALVGALGAMASYAMWGRPIFAAGAAAIATAVLALRRIILSNMARLSASIQADDPGAIVSFRKVHAAALLINLLQLVLIVWGVLQL
jgi:hypothetical protein